MGEGLWGRVSPSPAERLATSRSGPHAPAPAPKTRLAIRARLSPRPRRRCSEADPAPWTELLALLALLAPLPPPPHAADPPPATLQGIASSARKPLNWLEALPWDDPLPLSGLGPLQSLFAKPRAADAPARKTSVYKTVDGDIVKEIHTRGSSAARAAERELEAFRLFGGGDVVALKDSTVKHSDGGDTYLLRTEAATGNLRDGILGDADRGSIGMPHRLRMLVEILRGLAKIESGGWVHGDIRPENVFVFRSCFSAEGCHAKLGGLSLSSPAGEIDADLHAQVLIGQSGKWGHSHFRLVAMLVLCSEFWHARVPDACVISNLQGNCSHACSVCVN